jgi:hypothetical protein
LKQNLLQFARLEHGEAQKDGESGSFSLTESYLSLEKAYVASGEKVQVSGEFMAVRGTRLAFSIGCCGAVALFGDNLEELRANTKTSSITSPTPMRHLLELAPRYFISDDVFSRGTFFQLRCHTLEFCKYLLLPRDILLQSRRDITMEQATTEVYASIIERIYLRVVCFKSGRKGKLLERERFRKRRILLTTRTQRAFRWLEMKNKFGIGIMALMSTHSYRYLGGKISPLDQLDLSDTDFRILLITSRMRDMDMFNG